MKNKFFLSVVSAVFNEEESIMEFIKKISSVLSVYNYEVILVDDGSTDLSLKLLKKSAKTNKRIKIVSLSRNFGQQPAILAGLSKAKGEAVVVLDSDLQDPPEIIPAMIKSWQENYEVVIARRQTREDSVIKRLPSYLFYRFFNIFAEFKLHLDSSDFYLLDHNVVNNIVCINHSRLFLRGLISWIGFRQKEIMIHRNKRVSGKTKYSTLKMLRFAIDGMEIYSNLPLFLFKLFFIISTTILVLSYYFSTNMRASFLLLIIANFINLILLFITSNFVYQGYKISLNKPLYIIRELIGFDE